MENFLIFMIFVSVIFGAAMYGIFFSKKSKVKRKLKKASSSNIGNFKDLEVAKIIGTIEPIGEPLIAPLSKRPCVFFHVHVEEENDGWTTLIEQEVGSKFLIRDGEHYAYINGVDMECYVVLDKKYSSGFANDATVDLERFLNSHGQECENFLGLNKSLRYLEGILEGDEQVAVFGSGVWREAAELDLPKEYGKVLEIIAPEESAVYVSDDPDTTLHKARKISEHVKSYSYVKTYK